jgi:hypothetical protein
VRDSIHTRRQEEVIHTGEALEEDLIFFPEPEGSIPVQPKLIQESILGAQVRSKQDTSKEGLKVSLSHVSSKFIDDNPFQAGCTTNFYQITEASFYQPKNIRIY